MAKVLEQGQKVRVKSKNGSYEAVYLGSHQEGPNPHQPEAKFVAHLLQEDGTRTTAAPEDCEIV